jgi:lambda family phage portal protein
MSIVASVRRRVGAFIGGFGGGFEAAQGSRRLRNFAPSGAHINTLMASAGPTILARARFITRNNGYAINALEAWAGNVVGAGITPSFRPRVKTFKAKLAQRFAEWVPQADAEGLTDFYGLQRRAAREMHLAGEVFVRLIPRRLSDGLPIPLQLQIIPAEMLSIGKTEPLSGGTAIRQGIEFDAKGKRVAYHFCRKHPGDYTDGRFGTETVRVPASEVIHLFDPAEGGQIRGVSRYAAALVKLFLLDVYDDAELDRKKVAAMHAIFVKTPDPEGFNPAAEPEDTGPRNFDLQPGTVTVLEPGEDIVTSSPAESGASYEPFQYRTLLQVSAALGIPYTILSNDMVRANYANQRAALIEFRRRVEAFQHSVMVFQFCRRVMDALIDVIDLAGLIAMPGLATPSRRLHDGRLAPAEVRMGRSLERHESGSRADQRRPQVAVDGDRGARL